MAALTRAGNALSERVSGDPKIRVNQVFPGPLNIGCSKGKGGVPERQESRGPENPHRALIPDDSHPGLTMPEARDLHAAFILRYLRRCQPRRAS
jgi:hypothetical protein